MIHVKRLSSEEWYRYAEEAHKLVFKKQRDPWVERISFALLAHNENEATGYVTCRETDSESLYWQFGGSLDEFRGVTAYRGLQAIHQYAKDRYKRISTLVENNNVGYLHMLMKMGFRAIGIRNFKGEIYLEMFTDFEISMGKKED